MTSNGRAATLARLRGRPPVLRGPARYFVGVTRFSVYSPDSTRWQLTRANGASDPEQYAAALFSEARMGPRCRIFCDLAAPIYQQMAERYDYRHLVLYSPRLPDRWRSRLEEAARQYPVLQLRPVDRDDVLVPELVAAELARIRPRRSSLVYAFRVDDDDLVSADYLDQIAPFVTRDHEGFSVSLARGYAGMFEENAYTQFRQIDQPLIAIGLGSIGRWDPRTSRLRLDRLTDHRRTHHRQTVLLDAQHPSVLWTRHVLQDSAPPEVQEATDPAVARELLRKRLRQYRPVPDITQVVERFPTLTGSATRT